MRVIIDETLFEKKCPFHFDTQSGKLAKCNRDCLAARHRTIETGTYNKTVTHAYYCCRRELWTDTPQKPISEETLRQAKEQAEKQKLADETKKALEGSGLILTELEMHPDGGLDFARYASSEGWGFEETPPENDPLIFDEDLELVGNTTKLSDVFGTRGDKIE